MLQKEKTLQELTEENETRKSEISSLMEEIYKIHIELRAIRLTLKEKGR